MTDGSNRAMQAVQLRKMAIGDGTGPGGEADDSRTALRSQKMSVALVGTTMASGRLAVRATFEPPEAFSVTEAGIIARVGDAGSEFLFAYYAVASGVDAVAAVVNGTPLILAGVLDVSNAAADINVTVSADITFGGPGTLVALTDVPNLIAPHRYLRGNSAGTAVEWNEAPAVVATEAALPAPAQAVATTYAVANYAASGEPVIAQLAAGQWWYTPTRTWVRAQVAALAGAAPAALDTVVELAAALKNNPAIVDELLAAIGLRLTQAQVDARIATKAPKDVVLASDIDLAAGTRVTQALSESMDGFRWLGIVAGDDADDYGTYLRVPRAGVGVLVPAYALRGWILDGSNDAVQLYDIDANDGTLTARGSTQQLTTVASPKSASIATHNGETLGWVVRIENRSVQLYVIDDNDGTLTARGSAQSIPAGSWDAAGIGPHDGSLFGWILNTGTDKAQLYVIDANDGTLTARGSAQSLGVGDWAGAGIVSRGGSLLGWAVSRANPAATQLYVIDANDGTLTARGSAQSLGIANGGADGAGIAPHNSELLGWLLDNATDTTQLYVIDANDGTLTARGSAQSLGVGYYTGAGLVSLDASEGAAHAAPLHLDRAAANSLGMRSNAALRIHEIVGIA